MTSCCLCFPVSRPEQLFCTCLCVISKCIGLRDGRLEDWRIDWVSLTELNHLSYQRLCLSSCIPTTAWASWTLTYCQHCLKADLTVAFQWCRTLCVEGVCVCVFVQLRKSLGPLIRVVFCQERGKLCCLETFVGDCNTSCYIKPKDPFLSVAFKPDWPFKKMYEPITSAN